MGRSPPNWDTVCSSYVPCCEVGWVDRRAPNKHPERRSFRTDSANSGCAPYTLTPSRPACLRLPRFTPARHHPVIPMRNQKRMSPCDWFPRLTGGACVFGPSPGPDSRVMGCWVGVPFALQPVDLCGVMGGQFCVVGLSTEHKGCPWDLLACSGGYGVGFGGGHHIGPLWKALAINQPAS